MLDRLFGEDGFFGAGAWWIIVLFFLFLAFGESLGRYRHNGMDTILNIIINNLFMWWILWRRRMWLLVAP